MSHTTIHSQSCGFGKVRVMTDLEVGCELPTMPGQRMMARRTAYANGLAGETMTCNVCPYAKRCERSAK